MTPAARISAAIGILDTMLAGGAAEKLLTTWGRKNRYAGSGDRAAIRDHVYGALRCRRSFAWLGGAATGRGLMLGALRAAGQEPAGLFTGEGYAPEMLRQDETGHELADAPRAVRYDLPDWLMPALEQSLGGDLEAVAEAMRARAPVFLRVNLIRTDRAGAIQALAADGISCELHGLATTALRVTGNPRRVQGSAAYRDGLVELQDAASQAVVETLPCAARVLDYCAGGGGKALALAARSGVRVFAHDIDPARMRDVAPRAERAGAAVTVMTPRALGTQARFGLVLCDAPCSGSGTWGRAPEAKWRLTPGRLQALSAMQDEILDKARLLVEQNGVLAYATCSLLTVENEDRMAAFLVRHSGWRLTFQCRYSPLDGGDGFYVAHLTRKE
ncbi:MAG: RsmB/NOP family class I SAM-dependent RNA methyltransferase [Rhodobacteraceae bacterium]|nr:RsmB/NOP family class I SAM-dependent RNA methyltransferase [Paracoccaceae bacterium]